MGKGSPWGGPLAAGAMLGVDVSMSNVKEILGYDVLATLGEGAKSKIYAVKDRHNQVYALKHVIKSEPKDSRFIEQALLEHRVSSRLNHPCLRRSYKVVRLRRLLRINEVFVLMEMIDGITLEGYQPPDLVRLCQVCGQIAEGLMAMHEAGYVHADIKPNNVMVTDDGQVKIIDFGQSCRSGTVKERIQGTPDYIAPEQVRRKALSAAAPEPPEDPRWARLSADGRRRPADGLESVARRALAGPVAHAAALTGRAGKRAPNFYPPSFRPGPGRVRLEPHQSAA